MKTLTPLPDDPTYINRYIGIRDSKHLDVRTSLVAAHNFVAERFEIIEAATIDRRLQALTEDPRCVPIKDALRSCYQGITKLLRDLKESIKGHQSRRLLKYCPMCGTTIHSTFDHYLPAIRFPEFSVHALNLVPCCSRCNSIKDDDWLDADGQRKYLHFFSDEIPDVAFVVATLYEDAAFTGVGATFSLSRPQEVSDQIWLLISSHFRCLKLIDRYSELSNDEIAEILADCRIYAESGGADVPKFLRSRGRERAKIYGHSHWISVLMLALADHPKLNEWVDA